MGVNNLENVLGKSASKAKFAALAVAAGLASSGVKAEVSQVLNTPESQTNQLNISGGYDSFGVSLGSIDNSLKIGVESINNKPIASIEYVVYNGTYGALITYKQGSELKSLFATGTWNGQDLSLKATVGAMQKELQGKKINQLFLGLQGNVKINDSLNLGAYVNHSSTQDKTLNSWSEEKRILDNGISGTQTTTYTDSFDGYGKTSVGATIDYIIDDRNKFSGNVAYSRTNKSGVDVGLGYNHLSSDYKQQFGANLKGSTNSSNSASIFFSTKIGSNGEINIEGGRRGGNGNKYENFAGVGYRYYFDKQGSNTYSPYKQNEIFLSPNTHVIGADESSKNLYGQINQTKNTFFNADENIKPEINDSLLRIDLIPFKTVEIEVPEMEKGQKEVVQEGRNGEKEIRVKLETLNGKVISRTEYEVIKTQAQDKIVRVGTKEVLIDIKREELIESEVQFDVEYRDNPEMEKGQERTLVEGKNGYTKVVYEIKTKNGEEVSRKEISREVVAPTNKVVERGTKEVLIDIKREELIESEVQFDIEYRDNPEIEKGQERTLVEGKNGYTKVVYEIKTKNGEEVSRKEISREVVAPTNKVVERGTKEVIDNEPLLEGYYKDSVIIEIKVGETIEVPLTQLLKGRNLEKINYYGNPLFVVKDGKLTFTAYAPGGYGGYVRFWDNKGNSVKFKLSFMTI